jgi:hypothetical protein
VATIRVWHPCVTHNFGTKPTNFYFGYECHCIRYKSIPTYFTKNRLPFHMMNLQAQFETVVCAPHPTVWFQCSSRSRTTSLGQSKCTAYAERNEFNEHPFSNQRDSARVFVDRSQIPSALHGYKAHASWHTPIGVCFPAIPEKWCLAVGGYLTK